MNFNFASIFGLLPVILAALAQQSATVPVTVGSSHFLVSINRNPGNPGHSSWADAFQIVLHVLGGQPGSFTAGVFSVTIAPLSASGAAPTNPAGTASGVPPGGFAPGPR